MCAPFALAKGACLFAQAEFLDLARRRLGQFAKDEGSRAFEMREVLAAETGEFGFNCGMGMMTPGSKFIVVEQKGRG